MSTEITTSDKANIMENVIVKGDLSKLTPEERGQYYMKVCESVGLNPLTKPFDYITLNGKLTLYALRGCTDQLRSVHGVSVEELTESEKEGVFIVTAKVRNKEGRTDIAKGAVTITGLKGEQLANALMKCETKAKRRATLSICGLGLLDETEIETIPSASIQEVKSAKSIFKNASLRKTFMDMVYDEFDNAETIEELKEKSDFRKDKLEEMLENGNEHDVLAVEEARQRYKRTFDRLKQYEVNVASYGEQFMEVRGA